jgi:hypothetical protein
MWKRPTHGATAEIFRNTNFLHHIWGISPWKGERATLCDHLEWADEAWTRWVSFRGSQDEDLKACLMKNEAMGAMTSSIGRYETLTLV